MSGWSPRWPRDLPSIGFLGVVGPSGSGKSSAVRAGLVPAVEAGALGETRWVRVILRPGSEPMRELDRVVFAALDEAQRSLLPPGQDPLVAAASVLPEGTRLLVVVDQFEEVFTSVEDDGGAVGVHRVAGRCVPLRRRRGGPRPAGRLLRPVRGGARARGRGWR